MTDTLDEMTREIGYETVIETETVIGTETGIVIENVGVERTMQTTGDAIEEKIVGRGHIKNRQQR